MINEPACNKTYNKTCVTSKDSGLYIHPVCQGFSFIYLWIARRWCDWQRLLSVCMDAQADLVFAGHTSLIMLCAFSDDMSHCIQ